MPDEDDVGWATAGRFIFTVKNMSTMDLAHNSFEIMLILVIWTTTVSSWLAVYLLVQARERNEKARTQKNKISDYKVEPCDEKMARRAKKIIMFLTAKCLLISWVEDEYFRELVNMYVRELR